MNFAEEVLTVWRALLANKLRSFLTLIGVIIGVGTIVVLSSLMGGGLQAIGHTVDTASGDDLINVSLDTRVKTPDSPPLSTADIRALSGAAGLQHATIVPQIEERTDVRGGGREMRARVVGTNEDAMSFYRLEMARGRFLTALDRLESRRVAVIGREVAKTLFPGGPHHAELYVAGQRVTVVGVLSNKATLNIGNQTWNNSVILPDSTYLALKGQSGVDVILVKTNDPRQELTSLAGAGRTIRAVLGARNHPGDSLKLRDSQSLSDGERGFLDALEILLYAVAVISMGVGGINIMNIMLVTVTERTREIGLRLAIGARQRDIRRQFLFEAAAIAAFGGLVGVLGGLLLSWITSYVLTYYLGYWPFIINPGAVVVAFASALLIGVVFGWYPASRAASLAPIECLRYE